MTTTAPEFTPGAVRDTLLAAGHVAHVDGEVPGFSVGDGRATAGEILVEARRGTSDPRITDVERAELRARTGTYLDVIRAAGYTARIEMRMVVITSPPATRQPDAL